MPLPYQGRPGKFDPLSPTLIPNFYKGFMSLNGTLDYKSPAKVAQDFPQTAATATATIGGTITSGNTVTLTVSQGQFSGGAISGTYTVQGSDTVATVAEGVATALNEAAESAGNPFLAEASEAVVTVSWPGPMGNTAVLSATKSGGATETITLSPSNGVMSGGTGPVFCANNFNFTWNGSVMSFYYGKPYFLGNDLLSALANADMPVV